MADWYIVQTKARQEAIAEVNLRNQAFDTFLPKLYVHRPLRGHMQRLCEPMFPGYLFVMLDTEIQNIAVIRSTRGVVRLVRQGISLVPFPEDLLQALRQTQVLNGEAIDPGTLLNSGDEVTILSGPMEGMKAIFKARSSQERVTLLLNMLGVGTHLSVPSDIIEKVG